MSDDKDRPSTLGKGPEIIIKGGTTPGSYDKAIAEARQASELGRSHQDKQMQAAAQGDQLTEGGFVSSRLHSLRLMDKSSLRAVLYYMERDGKTVRQECESEVVVLPDGDRVFVMMCPRCFERGVPADHCQLQVHSSHRKWEIDTRREGELVRLVDPFGKDFWVKICGTISSDEILRCTNFNCNWAVRIEDSKVREV